MAATKWSNLLKHNLQDNILYLAGKTRQHLNTASIIVILILKIPS